MLDDPKKTLEKLKMSGHNFLQIWMSCACIIDKNNLYDLQIVAF
jgi:hypothetical protein